MATKRSASPLGFPLREPSLGQASLRQLFGSLLSSRLFCYYHFSGRVLSGSLLLANFLSDSISPAAFTPATFSRAAFSGAPLSRAASSMEHLSNLTDPLTAFSGFGNGSGDSFSQSWGSPSYVMVRKVQTVLVPLIFLFGVLGNLLAIGCFLSQSLRSTSCGLYMAAKCTSDTAFLASLFIMWLYRVHVDVVNVQGVCQLTVFISYVSGFVSVWLVLAITYENYIRVCCPYLTKIRCTRRVALVLTAIIVVFALVFYSFALWTTKVLGEGPEEPLCMSLLKFKDVLMVMTFIDTVITLVLPCLIIVPLDAAALVAIFQAYDRKSRLHDTLLGNNSNPHSFQKSMEAKVAKFLLTVSLTFLLLHTPGHLIRLKLLVNRYIIHS